MTGTLHEKIFTSMTITLWILPRMKNFSNKICSEHQNTHFMFIDIIPKIVPLMK
jgi:hypothetical protein